MRTILFFLFLSGCSGYVQIVTGPQGVAGPMGPQGPAGTPAQNCTVQTITANSAAKNGGSLISCPDGTQSLVLNGTNGVDGVSGSNGTPGAVITPVQFCKGITPTYPSAFPEVGFCINNQLYAVYSQNGGFMSLITPGTYSSDGINASCTFTVQSDCVVE